MNNLHWQDTALPSKELRIDAATAHFPTYLDINFQIICHAAELIVVPYVYFLFGRRSYFPYPVIRIQISLVREALDGLAAGSYYIR